MKNKIIISLIFLMLLVLTLKTNATVGVTSFYYEENPLMVNAGEIRDVVFMLQNNGEGDDALVKVTPSSGQEIAKLADENLEYSVPLGSNNIPVRMRITVPEDSQPGDQWSVGASFSVFYNPKGEGVVSLSTVYNKDFKVIVQEETPITTQATKGIDLDSPLMSFIILIVILMVLIFLIKIFSKKKK